MFLGKVQFWEVNRQLLDDLWKVGTVGRSVEELQSSIIFVSKFGDCG